MDAAHEFGHALGFQNEQTRPDSPDWCIDWAAYATEFYKMDTTVGAWDLESIMNYFGQGEVVSPTDIEMVQQFYGKPSDVLYYMTKQKGPSQEISAYDIVTQKEIGAIPLPANSQSLINRVIASPDGKRVYVLNSDQYSSEVAAIDTDTNTIAYVRANKPAILIDQLEVSPDSKTLYLLSKTKSSVSQSFCGVPKRVMRWAT